MTLIYLAGAWLLGIAVGAVTGDLFWPAVAGIATAGLAGAAVTRRPQLALLGILAAGLFLAGTWRYVDQQPPDTPTGIAVHNDTGAIRFRALVSDEPEVRGRTQRVQLSVREGLLDGGWKEIDGGVLLRQGGFPRYQYGDVLELEGELETPPSFPDFDYRDYLARKGIGSLLAYPDDVRVIDTNAGSAAHDAVHDVRRLLGESLAQALPEPQAALAQGIFLGQRSAIPEDLTEDMNATGTSHLIAISGHNVSLVAALMISSFAWLIGRRQAALLALVAIAAYTLLTGASPTVVRAAIMGGLFIAATLVGRPSSAGTSIALAAAIMTAWNPLVIEDVSFQLSFAAILGIVYLAPALQDRGSVALSQRGIQTDGGAAAFLIESIAITTAAVLATMPLFALYFDRVSIVTFAANVVLVPAFPIILGGSALTAVAAAVWEPLGYATSWLSWAALTYMIEVARFFAAVPLAAVDIDGFGRWHAAVAYALLGAVTWWLTRQPVDLDALYAGPQSETPVVRVSPSVAGGVLLLLAAVVVWWTSVDDGSSGRLTVSVLDVGQGDAILIEAPDGRQVLVDGGASGQQLAEALGGELPFWDRSLDLVALTHPQEDHMGGLVDAMRLYDVGQVLTTTREGTSPTFDAWQAAIERGGAKQLIAVPGMRIDLGDGAVIRVLAPDERLLDASDANDSSLVLRLEYGDASFLLTGDVQANAEEALLHSDEMLASTVLKVPHHGSLSSTTPAFVSAVQPAVAVISAGEGNPYGHPSPTVLERLGDAVILRTDQHGTVRFSTDGDRLWVEPER